MTNPYKKFSDADEAERRRRESATDDLRTVVERIIDDAQARGAFENLPGKGRPLDLNRKNPYEGDRELAFKLLKDNDYTLPWIADRNEMLEKIGQFRAELEQLWLKYSRDYRMAPGETHRIALRLDWRRQLEMLALQVASLNGAITRLNLAIPVIRLEVVKLNLERELAKFGGTVEIGE